MEIWPSSVRSRSVSTKGTLLILTWLDFEGQCDMEGRTHAGLDFHLNSPSEELGQNDRSWLFRHGRQELKISRNDHLATGLRGPQVSARGCELAIHPSFWAESIRLTSL